jgi:hypothetical protein
MSANGRFHTGDTSGVRCAAPGESSHWTPHSPLSMEYLVFLVLAQMSALLNFMAQLQR